MPVYAVANGMVIYAALVPSSTWGRLVVVRHNDGMYSRYGHLRTTAISAGQAVSRGQILGKIGGTEYGVPDHLHFDMSPTGILESIPTYWPGDNLPAVLQHFIDPKQWLCLRHFPSMC